MKHLPVIAVFAVLHLSAWSQTATVHGRVRSGTDSTALVGTTVVMAGNLQVNAMSGAEGEFELKGVPAGARNLQFIYLGYEQKTVPVIVRGTRVDMGNIYLAESANTIDAVVVKAAAPMAIMRNDTVQYNAEAFKTNPDADADELITKMPGVVIQNGKIEAQGEPVRRVYVDGKLFFGTDPMAALKSLPADAVESIQLFDAPSEESRMTGFDDGNTEKAINIVTKTKQRESTIIKAEAGGGADLRAHDRDFRYLTGGNFSRFTEKRRITFSLLSNNVNTQRFGDSELSGDQELDANGNVKNQPQGVQNINGAGVNYVYDDSKKFKIESSYFFDRNRNHTVRHTENNYYPTEGITQKSSMSDDEYITTRITNRANLRLEYRPSKNDHFVFMPRLTATKVDTDPRGAYALNVQDDAPIRQILTFTRPASLNLAFEGDLLWTHRFAKKGRSLTLSFNYSQSEYNYDQYQTDSLRQNRIDGEWTDANRANRTNRYITTDTYTNSIRGRVTWTEPVAAYHRILGNYTYRREWSDYDKLNNKYSAETGGYTTPEASQTNVYDRDYTTHSLGLGYGLYTRIFTLTAEMAYQRAEQKRMEERPNRVDTRFTFFSWQPQVSLKYTIQKKRYLRLRYSGRPVLPNIAYMQDVLNTTSRMYPRYGNPDLKEGYNNSLQLFYNATRVEKSTNLTFSLRAASISGYVAQRNWVVEAVTEQQIREGMVAIPTVWSRPDGDQTKVDDGAIVGRYENMDGYYTGDAAAMYSFTLRPIKSNINLSGMYGRTQVPSYYGGDSNLARTNSYGVRVGITSNISPKVDFNIYSTTAYNDTKNSTRDDNTYLNQNFFYSVNIIFWKGFVFNSVLSWRYYDSSTAEDMNSSYYVLNAALGKKVFARQNGEIRLSVYDALDQNRNRLHYVRDTYVQDVTANTVGRYVTLRFSYRFNSMTAKPKGTVEIKNARQIGLKDVRGMSAPREEKK